MSKQPRGQKRAAKVAARKRKQRTETPPARPVTTLPGPDDYPFGEGGPEGITALEEMRYTVAEIRTVRQIGAPAGADGTVDPEWLEILEGNLDGLAELTEQELIVEILDDRLRRVVRDTLASASPEPAREEVGVLLASDGETGDPDAEGLDGAPAQGIVLALLLGWLSNRGTRIVPAAARTRVPEWAAETLGAEPGRAVAAVIGVIGSDEDRQAALGPVADELGDDFLAALMWIVAGLVGLYAEGDADSYLPLPATAPAS